MRKSKKGKYQPEMNQKAYDILAAGGTHAMVCRELGIAEQTFYRWLGRGEYGNSKYFKSEFCESIERGEVAGRAWLDESMIKAATEKYDGNPSMLINMAKRRDFVSRVMPILKKANWLEKLDALDVLCSKKDISLDIYEQALCCLEKQVGVVARAKFEEFEEKLNMIEQRINSAMDECSQC